MKTELKEQISSADIVIVGIGNEWNWVKTGINNDPRYGQLLEYCNHEGNHFLLPIVEYEYAYYNSDNRISEAYKGLRNLIGEKKYFVISDTFLLDAPMYGFDPDRCVNPCGNYIFLQSAVNDELYEATKVPEFMEKVESIHKIITELDGNIGEDSSFSNIFFDGKQLYLNQKRQEYSKIKYNESAYLEKWGEYMNCLGRTLNANLLILELGVGLEFPTVIRWPFEKVAFINKKAHLVRVHEKLYHHTPEIEEKTDSIQMNSVDYILQESKGL
ncbi:MAG: hypothetical protein II842_03155 [Butyrivibrio sp.]|nr:hypothetical protein [Butyrivibrio sp.]